jgi:hypothetical protein
MIGNAHLVATAVGIEDDIDIAALAVGVAGFINLQADVWKRVSSTLNEKLKRAIDGAHHSPPVHPS